MVQGKPLKAPFPYFGGKSRIAKEVWAALGQPAHYIEPFFGSGAVLLLRPDFKRGLIETICDKDGFVCNVWRALQHAPDEVARWCDWPVNHADLMARRKILIANENKLLENLIKDDSWYDPKMAGYWIWAASCWIGNGLKDMGAIPHIIDSGKGVHSVGVGSENIFTWFRALSERLRYVRVVCGDWTRVCGGNWHGEKGTCGMFFDPPYGVENRNKNLYHHDTTTVAKEVMQWARERGENKKCRIVLAGYEEYEELIQCGWRVKKWVAGGGYGNQGNSQTQGKKNRYRECLYFSPHCELVKQKEIFMEEE